MTSTIAVDKYDLSDEKTSIILLIMDSNIFYVGGYGPGNYTKIQAAIENASDGDTVFVYNGTYYEHLVVNKSLILLGENKNNTIIDGNESGDVISIIYHSVTIKGFTIRDSGKSIDNAGIKVLSDLNTINDNIFYNNQNGIYLSYSFNNILKRNTITESQNGIYLSYSFNNILKRNTITESGNTSYPGDGINILYSSNNTIADNNITNNDGVGISIFYSDGDNVVCRNTITDNYKDGIVFYEGSNNSIFENHIENNNDNGIYLIYSSGNIITRNVIINNNESGIYVWGESYNNSISLNNITNNSHGVHLYQNTNNDIIFKNNITNNYCGVLINYRSWNNTVNKNNILNNNYGVFLDNRSYNNIITENFISNNDEMGIYIRKYWLTNSDNNLIYHNTLINNSQNAFDNCTNFWDDWYPSGGNYWDDYSGNDTNGDGIGDTPYDIPGGYNQDRYPLMHPWNGTIAPAPIIVYVDDDFNESTPGWMADHFDNIQDGVKTVVQDGTVYVYNGIYYENVVVDKSINLTGENKESTIIDAGGVDDAVYIVVDRVIVSGFTMQNSGQHSYPNNDAGVDIRSDYNTIFNNIIAENHDSGVYLLTSSNNNVISVNTIVNNSHSGIVLLGSCTNIIAGNTVANHGADGIGLGESSNNNTISGNTITNQKNRGIVISPGTGNNVIMNTISYNKLGIEIRESTNNNIYHNYFIKNEQNAYDYNLYSNYTNQWDNGYPSGGNYWSDYTGRDVNKDGIGDTPYVIPGRDNQDRYPLGFFDEAPPIVKIIKPEKALYIMNIKVRRFLIRNPLIIGDITIEVNATDEGTGIEKVEFIIDGNVKHTSDKPNADGLHTYTWTIDRFRLIHIHTIKAKAYDNTGNDETTRTMIVRKFL